MKVAERAAVPKVVNPDGMTDDNFVRHFNNRHREQLAGTDGIILDRDEYTIELYRKFHDKLHDQTLFPFGVKIPHEHGE